MMRESVFPGRPAVALMAAIAILTGGAGLALAQPQEDMERAPAEAPMRPPPETEPDGTGDAPADPEAEPVAEPPAPAATCEGMIAPEDLVPACEQALKDNDEWRKKLGRQLSGRVLLVLDRTKEEGDGESAGAKPDLWVLEISKELERRIHQREYESIQRNNRHVVMGYAALWVLMLGFVVFMWLKQKSLKDQIAALQGDIRAAMKD